MKRTLIVLIVLATLPLAACAPRVTAPTAPTILSPEEGAAYAAEVDEIAENFLVGWSECDFATATRDFEPKHWEGFFKENPFPQFCDEKFGTYGAYLSKTLDHVEDRPGMRARVVIYHVAFENSPDVAVRVFFRINNPDHLIDGFGLGDE